MAYPATRVHNSTMTLLDALRTWLKDDESLHHFSIEHSDREDFDAMWIVCPCSSYILTTIYDDHVRTLTVPPDGSISWLNISASNPHFFDILKNALIKHHQECL